MKYFFTTHDPSLFSRIRNLKPVSTLEQYTLAILEIIEAVRGISYHKTSSTLFEKELHHIKRSEPLSEKTPWGGVVLKKVDVAKDYIQKLLVIKEYGVLGFEIHRKKLEKLKVLEGTCIALYSNHKNKQYKKGGIRVALASPFDRFIFHPNDEHGIIALTNCVIEEKSTNHLDDLVYIFKTRQINSYESRPRSAQNHPK